MKRRSTGAAASHSAKRVSTGGRKAADSVANKVKAIGKVIDDAEGIPSEVVKMLVHALPHSLALLQKDRHFTQVEVIRMAKEVLTGMERKRASALDAATASLEESHGLQEVRDAAVEAAKVAAAARSEAVTAAKFSMHEAAGAEAAAKAARNDAEAARKTVAEALVKQRAVKEAHEQALNGQLGAIKAGTAENLEACVKALLTFGKKEGFEGQLLQSAEPALRKPAGERGPFDTLVIDKLEAELRARIAPLAEKVSALESEFAEHQPTIEKTLEAYKVAEGTLAERQAEHNATVEAEKEARAAIKAAEADAKACRPEAKKLAAAHAHAGAAIDEVREALKLFEELEVRALAADTPSEGPVGDVVAPAAEAEAA